MNMSELEFKNVSHLGIEVVRQDVYEVRMYYKKNLLYKALKSFFNYKEATIYFNKMLKTLC